MNVTKDFNEFINSCFDLNYNEVYELHQLVSRQSDAATVFELLPTKGSEDILVKYVASDTLLRLTPKAREFFPKWMEENLMEGFDAESYWDFKYQMEKDD